MPEQGDPPEAPQHLTFVHLGSRKMPFLQMAFMQRIPKIFRLPLLLCVPKWFSESHQLSIINLQQNKTHILIPARFHPYPALLQGRSKWEQAISELAIAKRKAHGTAWPRCPTKAPHFSLFWSFWSPQIDKMIMVGQPLNIKRIKIKAF